MCKNLEYMCKKPGKMCEFVPISVGEVTTKRAFKVINNMITSNHNIPVVPSISDLTILIYS